MKRFAGLAVFLAALLSPSFASARVDALPGGVSFVTSVEGIDEYRLSNGLRVLIFPDPSKQTTTVNITYLVGSAHEGYGETGMAHLLEHLLFKGSTNHPDIPQELTAHGCRPNGTTWFDRTNYFETFSATEENLEWALDLEADRMLSSFVAKKDLDSEMTVVRNEFEIGENSPAGVLEERVYSTAFLWHNYGNTTIGARSDIENVPIENLQSFYRTWYRPDNAILVVAGKLDEAQTLELVAQKFGRLSNPKTPLPKIYTDEPPQDGVRTVTLRRVGDKQVAALAYHIPAGFHTDCAPLEVLSFLLADTPSGRLHHALVETKRATEVRARADRFMDPGLLYVDAELREKGDIEGVQREMIRIVEGFADDPPQASDVDRARTSLLREWELTMRDSPRGGIRLSEWASMGDWRLLFLHRDRLEKVSPDDVLRVAKDYLRESNRTVGLYIPTKEADRTEVPENPDLAYLLKGYSGREAMARGEAFDATTEGIETRTKREKLSNGIELVSIPKKTRGETVNLRLWLHVGSEKSLAGKGEVANLTGQMLMRGTASRSRQDIQDEIDRHKASLDVQARAGDLTATLETTRASLPDMMRLLADVVRNPSFPKSEFAQLVESRLKEEEESKSDPGAKASNRLFRHLFPFSRTDVRYVATPEEAIEEIEKTEIGDLRAFHRNFYGAQGAEIAIVGDFDEEATTALLEELFGDFKAGEKFERLVAPYWEPAAIVETIETPDKESAVLQAGMQIKMREDHADYPAMVLANFMTGGGFLNSRLATRIRRQDGLSYGVRSVFNANELDESAYFSVFAIYAPQNDAKLVQALREELQRVIDKGFTDEEVAEAKSGWLQSRTVSRSQDRELVGLLSRHAYFGRTMKWETALEYRVGALTPQDVHAAFRKHIDPSKLSIVRAGDFAKAASEKGAEPAAESSKEHASK
jgi:zinc protease